MSSVRRPAVAGTFYPARPDKLRAQLEECFQGHPPQPDSTVLGAVVPHAGYIYSGRVAAHAYSRLPPVDTYILLGPNHRARGSAVAVSTRDWETPLGRVGVDREFIEALPRRIIDTDEEAHRPEHSLEVQVPMLQHRFTHPFRIVPILLGLQDEETARDVGGEVRAALEKTGRHAVVLASSDCTHYEPDEYARKTDLYVLEGAVERNPAKFYQRLREKDASFCGYGAIASMLHALEGRTGSAELLKYATSGDAGGDRKSVVGYAAILVRS
ncbi:MAG: MEMO1 family protein [Euryarchaeota archaeon]|nr:MEMO1 family protein [Euryarchaeota archaeon]